MRGIQTIDFDPDNAAATGIASEVDVEAVGALSITALAESTGVARQILFDDETAEGGDNASVTFVITGTDADGRAQQETITGLNDAGDSKGSAKHYNTVSGIEVGGTLTSAMTLNVGTNGVMVSKAILLDKYAINAPLLVQTLTGTMAWGIELTTQSLADSNQFANQGAVTWVDDADHTGLSASQQQNLADWPVAFCRVVTTSYTDTAELAVKISQGW